jgi:hypothetical protein
MICPNHSIYSSLSCKTMQPPFKYTEIQRKKWLCFQNRSWRWRQHVISRCRSSTCLTLDTWSLYLRSTYNRVRMRDASLLVDYMEYLISRTIRPNNLLHPSPVPHLKTVQVFVIYLPKCPIFNITNSIARNLVFYWFL